jgi:hypothetical protein
MPSLVKQHNGLPATYSMTMFNGLAMKKQKLLLEGKGQSVSHFASPK